jgi:hypothetical protein
MIKKRSILKKLSRKKLSRKKNITKKKQKGGETKNIAFGTIYHPESSAIEGRLVSSETNLKGEPLLELQFDDKTLILKFIRSYPPCYTFKSLLSDVYCYATLNKCNKIELEDDALFSDGDCIYRAIIYRVFQNKLSIYVDNGFIPIGGIENLNKYKDIIYNFTIENAKLMIPLFESLPVPQRVQEFIKLLGSLDISKNNDKFGEWLISNPCLIYREIFNRLGNLTSTINIEKTLSNENLNQATKDFLTAFNRYVLLHKSLERKPENLPGCDPNPPQQS